MFDFLKIFIERLAKSNEKEFKGQSPDCCTINQPEKVKPEDNKSQE